MILYCIGSRHVLNTIENIHENNNGLKFSHSDWKDIKDWYLDLTYKDSTIYHW